MQSDIVLDPEVGLSNTDRHVSICVGLIQWQVASKGLADLIIHAATFCPSNFSVRSNCFRLLAYILTGEGI